MSDPHGKRRKNGGAARVDWVKARKMRRAGMSIGEIAEYFDVTREWIGENLWQVDCIKDAAEVHRPDPPRLPPHPFWTWERDALLWATRGKLAGMAELAVRLGRSVADVQKRWHMLRGAK